MRHSGTKGKHLLYLLGLSAFYHDSAAALVNDGRIVAAPRRSASRERSTTRAFPPMPPATAWRRPASAWRTWRPSSSMTSPSSSSSDSWKPTTSSPPGPEVFPLGHPRLDQGEGLSQAPHPGRNSETGQREGKGPEAALHGPPPVSRRQRLLPVSLPGVGDPDRRRRRRVGHRLHLPRKGSGNHRPQGNVVSPFRGTSLFGFHLLPGVPGQLGEYKLMGLAHTAILHRSRSGGSGT